MKYIDLKLRCRLYEFNPLIKSILDSYKVNEIAFANLSPLYNELFLQNINQEIKIVDGIINPVELINKIKLVTKRIYINQNLLNSSIDLLEDCTKKAIGIIPPYTSFGFGIVRRANNYVDLYAVVKAMRNLTTIVDNNLTALIAAGYPATGLNDMRSITDCIDTDVTIQRQMLEELKKSVSENHITLNSVWDKIMGICDSGKIIFKDKTNKNRKEFEINTIIVAMRMAAVFTLLSGNIEPKSRIELKPLMGGRKKTVYAFTSGYFEMKGLSSGEYQATKFEKGKPDIIRYVTIISGKNIVENFE